MIAAKSLLLQKKGAEKVEDAASHAWEKTKEFVKGEKRH